MNTTSGTAAELNLILLSAPHSQMHNIINQRPLRYFLAATIMFFRHHSNFQNIYPEIFSTNTSRRHHQRQRSFLRSTPKFRTRFSLSGPPSRSLFCVVFESGSWWGEKKQSHRNEKWKKKEEKKTNGREKRTRLRKLHSILSQSFGYVRPSFVIRPTLITYINFSQVGHIFYPVKFFPSIEVSHGKLANNLSRSFRLNYCARRSIY